jgi:hypothetical protein
MAVLSIAGRATQPRAVDLLRRAAPGRVERLYRYGRGDEVTNYAIRGYATVAFYASLTGAPTFQSASRVYDLIG